MQVYEGLNHFADIVELTKEDVDDLQTSVKILALQKRDKTASFVEEYARHIIGIVQREAELIDSNNLEVTVAFPMLEGCALQVRFTGVNMDEGKYAQLYRALVLRIAGIANRYYEWLGRDSRMEENIEFKQVAGACEKLYDVTEAMYQRCAYQGWNPDYVTMMKNYANDRRLRLMCWVTETGFLGSLGLNGRTVKRRIVSGLDVHDERGVLDTLTDIMKDLVSDYSSKDSIIYLESADLGIVWLIKPVSAEMDGSVHISEANTLQMRYLVAEAVSTLGCYNCTRLSEYALSEAMGAVGNMLARS